MFVKIAQAIKSLRGSPERVGVRSYMPELDGLRCLAIIVVLVWHASLRAGRYLNHTANSDEPIHSLYYYFPHGEVGVILFFFISGFVVSQPFLLRPRGEWRIGEFYRRRIIRIYPPYLIVMVLCFFVLGVAGHVPTDANAFELSSVPLSQSFAASIVYLHGLIFNAPSRLNPPMWSLEIEVAFYAVLPPIMMLYTSSPSRLMRMVTLAVFIGAAVIGSSLLISSLETDLRLRWGLFYHAYLFLFGVLAADFVSIGRGKPHHKGIVGDVSFTAGIVILGAIGLMMTRYDARMPNSLYAFAIQVMTGLSLFLIFHGSFHGRYASAALSGSWVRLVGKMCYSIYLTHVVVMTAVGELIGHVLLMKQTWLVYVVFLGALIPTSIAAGLFFFIGVERPFANMLGRRTPKPSTPPMVQASQRG